MATKVQIENCLRGQSSTRDLSHESNGGSWPSCYTDGSLPKGRFHYGYMARTISDSHPGYNKDVVKQTMLEHEAIFKDQVYELHRLYRVQRGLMDEVRRKDPLTWSMPNEASSSSSPLPSHLQFDGAQRWNGSSYPQGSPCSGKPLISGPDIVQSSPNSVKGKSILAGPSPFQNCYSPKTSEASEFRPTKFRKRTLDLQLRADEFIDTDEVEQVGCSKDLHISKRKALADLNEPLPFEETTTFPAFGILGHSGSHSDASYRDLPAELLSSSKDTSHNSKKLSLNGTSHNLPEIQANGQHWFRHALGSEKPKAFVRSIDQEVTPEKAPVVSRPVQILTSEHIKREPWKTNSTVLGQNSDYYSMSNHHNLGSRVSSQTGLSWNQSAWGKPSLPIPKPISSQSSMFQSSVHSTDFFGKRDQTSSIKPNAGFGSEPPVRNGFSHGSSAAFTELPACLPKAGSDYVNCNYNENKAANNGHNSIKSTTCNIINPVRDINLNDTLPNGVFTDKMEEKDCKPVDPLSVLPWLRGKGAIEPEISESCQKILGVSIFGNPPKQKDPLDNSSKGKHLFDMNLPCDETSDSEVDKMAIDEVVVAENKEIKSVSFRNNFDLNCCMTEDVGSGIDLEALINLENEDELHSVQHSIIKEPEMQPPGVRPENSVDDGDVESAASAIVAMSFCVKSTQSSMEERVFLPPEAQGDDPLHWFVSIACSTGNDGVDDFEYMILRLQECTPEEYFPKPSIPDFTIIENNGTCILTSCILTSRTRKGPGRRGRQKRDFQRDILPGLTTLSRHEVTKDLQTFGELMRATGYSWQSGPNRRNAARNGRGRGRRRFVETTLVLDETVCALPLKQQEVHCDLVEVSVVDRSLTGWGKTTRRPRRQRCPAGMGTKVQTESYLPRQSLTIDLTRESNGGCWPSCYTDGSLPNGQFHYGFSPKPVADSHSGYGKDVLKQTMLEHEAIFKDQVYELHRLYRVQRGLMDEVRRNEPFKHSIPYEASSSSSPLPLHRQLDGARKWNDSCFPLASPCSGRPLISGLDTAQSSPNLVKGKSILVGPSPSPFHNCYSPKTSEASEARPTKFRKRILDLQLPADEYIDTDEVTQFGSAEDLHISKRKALADLNEPLHFEETSTFSSFGNLGHVGRPSDLPYRDLSARLLSSSKDMLQNSMKLSLNGTPKNLHDIRTNGQDWFCYAFESEQHKISTRSIHQEVHPEKSHSSSRPVQILTSEHIKREPWKPNSAVITQNSDSFSMSNYYNPGSHVSSQPGLSWGQSATSWGKANFMTPNPISIPPSLFQSSVRSNEFFGKWDPNSSRGPNVAFGGEPPVKNGFSQGSSSIFEERPACFPQASFDYVNCNYSENKAPFKVNSSIKGNSCNNIKPVRDMNLNESYETLTNGVFADKIVDKDCKAEDPLASLPWLRGKAGIEAKMSGSSHKILGVSIFGNPPKQKDPLDHNHRSRHEEVECSKREHLFDMNLPCDEASDSEVGKMSIDEVVVKKETSSVSFKISIDLNSCVTEEMGTGIDLEALFSLENEDGILSVEDSLIKDSQEQPVGAQPDSSAGDGDAESAASAIVAMSSCVESIQLSVEDRTCLPPEAQGDDPLHWFVSIVCCTENDGLDDFEYMILGLKECTPEEYFPKPSIPDFAIIENPDTCMLTSRTRKGQGRRGRQKRDFQRDILPGLTTLSRHEVTEDLQTFGGLMRATGFSWQSEPNRRHAARNGRGRGRRQSVETTFALEDTVCALPLKQQEIHRNMKVNIVDRSLTGWGKTTRRPRRQRCPAGNLTLQVTLT